jgi:ABC-type dipeptide/oligopeptide/nickel transport system permease subunit
VSASTPERGTGRPPLARALSRLAADRTARASLAFLALVALAALVAPLLPLPSPIALPGAGELAAEGSGGRGTLEFARPPELPWQVFGRRGFEPALWELGAFDRALLGARLELFGDWQAGHWLGTDARGRDLLARLLWASRTSLVCGLLAALASLAIGVGWGAVAGYAGGRTDRLMMRAVDVLYAIPVVFFAIFLITMLAPWRAELEALGIGRQAVFLLVIGAVGWLTMARVVRGEVRRLAAAEFIQAARLAGATAPAILLRHVLPNVLPVAAVYLTLTVPGAILFESFLSFLGLGVEAPRVSWGVLAAEGIAALTPVRIDWWLVAAPAAAMGSVLLALNLLGDGLRDALDPRSAQVGAAKRGARS